jgi:hypothetical protein
MLPEIDKFYTEHKYGSMSLILNGTDGENGRYGFKYGYHISSYDGYTKDE